MKKFFFIFGILAAVVVVVGGIGVFVLARNGAALDADAKSYVDQSVVAITAKWNRAELMKRASPEFLKVTSAADLDGLFDAAAAALGPLDHYEGAKGGASEFKSIGGATTISANYLADAKFQKGEASFAVALSQIDGKWVIDGFRINSDLLMRQLTGRGS